MTDISTASSILQKITQYNVSQSPSSLKARRSKIRPSLLTESSMKTQPKATSTKLQLVSCWTAYWMDTMLPSLHMERPDVARHTQSLVLHNSQELFSSPCKNSLSEYRI